MNIINKLLIKYIQNPKDPNVNFNLGLEYKKIGQTASAAGYFLRSIEFGNDERTTYEALLNISLCFEKQGNRIFTIKGMLLRAISYKPYQPEAYFLLSRLHERNKEWHESYTMSIIGSEIIKGKLLMKLKSDVEYPGEWGFKFERAVSSWWIGLHDESLSLFEDLNQNYNLDDIHKQAVINNLNLLKNL